ncbi:hypothetical protein ES703_44889 [subsurface metagenome]
MLIGEIGFPEPLIEAQRKGTLVVFAGAGVSMGPPSNLPSFEDLADEVASGIIERSEREPSDQFLGRLFSSKGVDVHARTKSIVDKPDSKPNRLHKALVSLFTSSASFRIVTTNFDQHFTAVAKGIFVDGIDIYYAPALPLGNDFNGIVYLHGCIERQPKDLVLTDQDFGRAYLTYGWATRFLQVMFSNYTTLFVGYSHGDTVMKYLARALPPGSKPRYAFSPLGDEEDWTFLGVTPLAYKKAMGRYPHITVQRSLGMWSERSKWGALDHENKIKTITGSPPSVDAEESDYLVHALQELENIRFFTRYANSPDWLRWAEDKLETFREIFASITQISEISQQFAIWFSYSFVCEYAEEALAILQRHNQTICPFLWHVITTTLAFHQPRPEPKVFSKWVSLLLQTARYQDGQDLLGNLLKSCRYPKDRDAAIMLFEHLTRPKLRLRPKFRFSEEDTGLVDEEVTIQAESYWLRETWGSYFRPNLGDFVFSLEHVVVNNLWQAHYLLRSIGKANDHFDPISYMRSAIEPHEQNRHASNETILIDAASDILEYLLTNQPEHASYLIEHWVESQIPLLRRLAIHGVSEDTSRKPDEKISWLLNKGLLYRYGVKHEVFRLLKEAYPQANDDYRKRLLEQVELGPQGLDLEGKDKDDRQYSIFNLLSWLHKANPDCKLASLRLKAFQEANPKFKPSEYPDLYSWIEERVGPRSPLTADELILTDAAEATDFLLCYEGERLIEPDREGLLTIVAEAVSLSFDWSWKLVEALRQLGQEGLDIWASIVDGWQKASLNEEQWEKVLTLLKNHPLLGELIREVVNLIYHGVSEKQAGLPMSCLPLAEQIADTIWQHSVTSSEEPVQESDDWLGVAINHVGGKVVEIWLHSLSRRRVETGAKWEGIPPEFSDRFEKVISGVSFSAQTGRVLLTSQLHFLFTMDAVWVKDKILPLFDWSIDDKRSQQAWHGYLIWGRWNDELLQYFLPLYEMTFCRLDQHFTGELREAFCRHLASIAIYSRIDPLKHGWLWRFLSTVNDEVRRGWASAIRIELDSLNEDAAKDLWDRWMNKYWEERITGVPVPLSQDEIEEMVCWATELGPVFPDVVNKICTSNPPKLENTRVYHDFQKKDFATKHPAPLTRLLVHLLPNTAEPFWQCEEIEELVRTLLQTTAPRDQLLQVCNELARLGCANANELGELCQN